MEVCVCVGLSSYRSIHHHHTPDVMSMSLDGNRMHTREHHPSYWEVWDEVLSVTRDPFEARDRFEPGLARREDYIERYRYGFGFHPVHGIMALYPLKRLRHAGRVIVAHPADTSIPAHCGFESAPTVEHAIAMAQDEHGKNCTIALVDYPPAVNRQ
jgi:hypothetical protein